MIFTHSNRIVNFNNRIIVNGSVPSAYDIDAQAFITAYNITDLTEQIAINQYVLDLKFYLLWNKFYTLYIYVGSNSFSNSGNLKNPSQYQITWHGSISHLATGIVGDGVSGYGDTNLNAASVLTLNNTASHTYVRTNSNIGYDMGCLNGTTQRLIFSSRITTVASSQQYSTTIGSGRLDVASANSQGMWSAIKLGTNHRIVKNGVSIATNTGSGGTLPNFNMFVLGLNASGTLNLPTNRQHCLDAESEALTLAETQNFHTITNNFQTALGRNIY